MSRRWFRPRFGCNIDQSLKVSICDYFGVFVIMDPRKKNPLLDVCVSILEFLFN